MTNVRCISVLCATLTMVFGSRSALISPVVPWHILTESLGNTV